MEKDEILQFVREMKPREHVIMLLSREKGR